MNTNINKIKEYAKQQTKDRNFILKKLFELYPELKKDKKLIMNAIKKKPESNKRINDYKIVNNESEIVVKQIKHNNTLYYLTKYNGVLNENGKLIGTFDNINNCILFFNKNSSNI